MQPAKGPTPAFSQVQSILQELGLKDVEGTMEPPGLGGRQHATFWADLPVAAGADSATTRAAFNQRVTGAVRSAPHGPREAHFFEDGSLTLIHAGLSARVVIIEKAEAQQPPKVVEITRKPARRAWLPAAAAAK